MLVCREINLRVPGTPSSGRAARGEHQESGREDPGEAMDTKTEPDVRAIVSAVLEFDAVIREGADWMGVKDEDFARMAEAFGLSAEQLGALAVPGRR